MTDPLGEAMKRAMRDGHTTLTPEEAAEFRRQMEADVGPRLEEINQQNRAGMRRLRNLILD